MDDGRSKRAVKGNLVTLLGSNRENTERNSSIRKRDVRLQRLPLNVGESINFTLVYPCAF